MKINNLTSKNLYKQWLILFFILFFLWAIIIYLIIIKNENKKNIYLNAEIKSFSSKITSILGSYENFSNYIFYENINNLEIQKIIRDAYFSNEEEKKELKIVLQKILEKKYLKLNNYGFSQLSFLFPTGESFTHYNLKEDKSNLKIYESAKIANVEKKYLKSFEEGNFYYGYRYVYILLYKGTYVGIVEISIPLTNLIEIYSNFYPNININYFVKSSFLKSPLTNKKYITEDKNFYFFNNYHRFHSIKNNKNLKEEKENEFFEKIHKKVEKKMNKNKSFGLIYKFENKNYTCLFIPVNGKNNEITGYIVSIYENSQYKKLYENLYSEIFLVSLIILVSLIGSFIFIKDRNKFQELSSSDHLTGLYNRSKFIEFANYELNKNLRTNSTFSILLMDIDYFKKINDIYGHNVGDKILIEISHLIKNNIRKTDILARWGGEEFICLLPDTNIDNAAIVAEKIREVVEKNLFPKVGFITLSIGVHEKSDKDFTIEAVNEKADIALYDAKKTGRNRIVIFK